MKGIKSWLFAAAFGFGCQSPSERVISRYASEENCMARLQYTLQPEADRAAFEREHGSGTCETGSPKMDTGSCGATMIGETCFVKIGAGKGCLRRTSEHEFKIDWQCSTGYNEVPVKTFKSGAQGTGVAIFRLRVELDDSYFGNYSGKKQSHQALGLSDRRSERLYGYVARGSDAGERLATLLSDGKKHDLMLAVASLDTTRSDEVEVLELVQEDWRTLPPASLEAAKKRAGDHLWDLKEAARIDARDRFLKELNAGLR